MIFISDYDIPNSCSECPLRDINGKSVECRLTHTTSKRKMAYENGRMSDCPLSREYRPKIRRLGTAVEAYDLRNTISRVTIGEEQVLALTSDNWEFMNVSLDRGTDTAVVVLERRKNDDNH